VNRWPAGAQAATKNRRQWAERKSKAPNGLSLAHLLVESNSVALRAFLENRCYSGNRSLTVAALIGQRTSSDQLSSTCLTFVMN
jgi:hypothetical protein